jgi:hypothetical protein
MGSTPKRPRCSSMNAVISAGADRAPERNRRSPLRISLARRSSAFSLRSLLSSSSCSVVRPERIPPSDSAWRTHRRSIS